MPIQVNIKRKDPKFEGDQPSFNIVVDGPVELFNDKLVRFLYLHGLNGMSDEGEHAVYSTPYSIGAPPYYLAGLLESKFGCKPKPAALDATKRSTSERAPEDGLEAFIGKPKSRAAGSAALVVKAGSKDFIANCDEQDWDRRKYLEGAGWIPVVAPSPALAKAFGSRPYKTRDPFVAGNLEHLMVPAAKTKLGERLTIAKRNIAVSKTQEAPENFAIPAPDGLQYLDFQKGGIQKVVEDGTGALIADDMGLGKTVQGIGVLNGRPDIRRAIVFCQANMRLKWVREIEKWKINQDLTVGHAEGSNWPDTDIVVINYDIAGRHADKFRGINWDLVLTDEAHNLKNHEAQRTQAVLGNVLDPEELAMIPLAEGGQIVHLTGTPKPNRIFELWPLLSSSRPDLWGVGPEARQVFLDRYEPPFLIKKKMPSKFRGGQEREIIIPLPGKPIRELELQMRLRGSGSFIRRMKRDTDMPPKMRTPIEMPLRLTKEDREILAQAEADLLEIHQRIGGGRQIGGVNLRKGESAVAAAVIDAIKGLPPSSPHFSEIARVRSNLGRLKAPYAAKFIIDELKEDNELAPELRRKTVVFAHHKEVIRILAEAGEKAFPGGVLVYDGMTGSAAKKQERVDRFQEDPKARLFIMSLSGATGITLTAAHRMRVVEPDWSPSNMVQIEDRIWRIGQEQACDIGYLFVPDTLDVNMGLALISKMTTDERAINTMSFDGLRRVHRPGEAPVPPPAAAPKAKPVAPAREANPAQASFDL